MTHRPGSIASGCWPTLVTPFTDDGEVDWPALAALVEWQVARSSAGLFVVCGSGEMFELSESERLGIAERTVGAARGRLPVVASGTFGGPVAEQARFVRRIAETGVSAVVVLTDMLAPGEPEASFAAELEKLVSLTGDVPLGLYEHPSANKRLLTADLVRWAGSTGRFVFLKDTCGIPERIAAKASAARGTALSLFNANTSSLLHSLQFGASGHSGVAGNCWPQLLAWLCEHFADPLAARLQRALSVMERALAHQHPLTAKLFLRLAGVPIGTRCRCRSDAVSEADARGAGHLLGFADDLCDEYRLPRCSVG